MKFLSTISALFSLFIALSSTAIAQTWRSAHIVEAKATPLQIRGGMGASMARVGDTATLKNFPLSDTLVSYYYGRKDSGYAWGTNVYGDRGFAERYFISGADSSVAVLGVMAQFTGKISPTSTKKVNFKVWNSTGTLPIHSKLAYNGLPDRCIATKTVAITNIGIRPGGDTLKAFLLDSPTYKLGNSFFVGYDIDYNFAALNGDTISVMGNANGKRRTPKYTIEVVVNDFGDTLRDTIINVQNATQWSDSVWHDNYYDNLRLYHHYALFPIVAVHSPSALPQVYTQGVGFGGAFPNPCNEQITIIFSTSACSKTTLQIFDINGKLLKTEELTSLDNTPQHISLSTTSYPAGKYLIYLSTAEGKGIGSIFEVGH